MLQTRQTKGQVEMLLVQVEGSFKALQFGCNLELPSVIKSMYLPACVHTDVYVWSSLPIWLILLYSILHELIFWIICWLCLFGQMKEV